MAETSKIIGLDGLIKMSSEKEGKSGSSESSKGKYSVKSKSKSRSKYKKTTTKGQKKSAQAKGAKGKQRSLPKAPDKVSGPSGGIAQVKPGAALNIGALKPVNAPGGLVVNPSFKKKP